jgi:hypothetical protein
MYSKSLWLRMGDVVILPQSLVVGFRLLSSHMTILKLWIMVMLKWEDCKFKMWFESNAKTIFPFSPTLQSTLKVAFMTFMCKKKLVFAFIIFLTQN